MASLTAVILTHNKCTYTRALLESLLPTSGVDFEVVVVDNGSTDETPAMLDELRVRFDEAGARLRRRLNGRNVGCSTARNLGVDMAANCERYWAQQQFGNSAGAMKPNCFTETSLTNNLVWYPRGAATFGLPLAMTRFVMRRGEGKQSAKPIAAGRWPLLPLADWAHGRVPWTDDSESNG